jgi:eukaryotic-like serine/threonine-protein kinase
MSSETASCPTCGAPMRGRSICPRCLLGMGDDTTPVTSSRNLPSPNPGSFVGDYELIEIIARGGMGVVWRARQRRLNRTVALKLVSDAGCDDEEAARRFQVEGEAVAALRHPHIVTVHEVGEDEGRTFLSMELVDGGALSTRLRAGRLPERDAAALVAKIARAVHHAHERGILHRDIKPGNILLDKEGEPRVTDFGLARLTARDSSITMTGVVLGTPAYMSPEQALGKMRELTTAADTYSLGAVLYECLTGHPPFRAQTVALVMSKVVSDEPERMDEVDRDLETIAIKCLEKESELRYVSALALADDLERWLRDEPITARRATMPERVMKWSRRKPALAALSFTVVVLVIAFAISTAIANVRLEKERTAAVKAEADTRHRVGRQFAQLGGRLAEEADWHRALLCYAEAADIGTGDLRRDRANRLRFEMLVRIGPRLEQIWFSKSSARLAIASDAKTVVISAGNVARTFDIASGAPRSVVIPVESRSAAVAINGIGSRFVAQVKEAELGLFDEGGTLVAAFPGHMGEQPGFFDTEAGFLVHNGSIVQRYRGGRGEALSKPIEHGAKVVWCASAGRPDRAFVYCADGKLHVWNMADGTPVVPPRELGAGVRFVTARAESYGAARAICVQQQRAKRDAFTLYDVNTGNMLAETTDVAGPLVSVGWNESGKWVAIVREGDNAVMSDLRTGNPLAFAPIGTRAMSATTLSPTGRQLLTVGWNGAARFWEAERGTPLSPWLWCATLPHISAISTDGSIAVLDSDDPAVRAWRLRPNNGAFASFTTPEEVQALWFEGSKIHAKAGESQLAWDVVTGDKAAPSGKVPRDSHASPDGTLRLAASENGMEVVRVETGKPVAELRDGSRDLDGVFSADGRRILTWSRYRSRVPEPHSARVWDAATGQPLAPQMWHRDRIRAAAFSADGRFVLTGGEDQTSQLWNAATGQHALAPIMHPAQVEVVGFSPDSVLFWTYSSRRLRVWETATGVPVTPEIRLRGISETAWSSDSTWFATWSKDDGLRVWDFRPGRRPVKSMRDLAKMLSSHRLAEGDTGSFVSLTIDELRAAWEAVKAEPR